MQRGAQREQLGRRRRDMLGERARHARFKDALITFVTSAGRGAGSQTTFLLEKKLGQTIEGPPDNRIDYDK